MAHDDELIERLAIANFCDGSADAEGWRFFVKVQPEVAAMITDRARRCADIVRAYDAERRSSVLDAAAIHHDPDDYRDLPLAMVEPVRFRGGLTEG